MIATWTIALLATWQSAPAASQPVAPSAVPRGGVVEIDGTLGTDEWRGALPIREGALEYLLKHDGEFLYIGVRGAPQSILTVAVAAGADRVRILHASAALGEVQYERKADGSYARGADFRWHCSDADADDGAAARGRARFLAEHDWLAATIGRGDGAAELKLRWKKLGGGSSPLTMTFNVAPALAGELPRAGDRWPAAVRDGTAGERLQQGMAPAKARFAIEQWGRLMLGE